jgi:FtsP/CotA-like multicopper oxidase with cupredoxin domain
MSMMPHPIHLHGHFFQVVSCDERLLDAPILKDTITLGHVVGIVAAALAIGLVATSRRNSIPSAWATRLPSFARCRCRVAGLPHSRTIAAR